MKILRLLLSVLLLLLGGTGLTIAQSGWSTNTYEADGIQYYLNNTTHEARVAIGNYSGEIVIPEYIWSVYPGNQDGLVQANNPYWGGYRVTGYEYVNNSGVIQTPFSNNSAITKVTLPQSIHAIKDGTFLNCTQLEEVRLLGCFFANSYEADTHNPSGISANVFTGCTSLRHLYADDPRVVCVRRRRNTNTGSMEKFCPLAAVLGSNTTTNLTLHHNAGIQLASYFPDQNVKQEVTSLPKSKLQVTIDFFPYGDVSYIDYGYTLNVLYNCNVTETSQAITARKMSIDCLKQGSKTFVLRNVPNVSPYLKPYIQVGDAEPEPMCIFGDTFYYTVYANPDANSNTNVRIMYLSPTTWGAGLALETPGNIAVYVDNHLKINEGADAGTYSVASPEHPFTTYEIALDYDTLRYVVKAFDNDGNEYPLLNQYNGIMSGEGIRYGKKYFRTSGSASHLDYQVRLTATDIPIQLWYSKPVGIKLTVSGQRKDQPFTSTFTRSLSYFFADPDDILHVRLDGVHEGLIPRVLGNGAELELDTIEADGVKYYETSYVPRSSEYVLDISTTQRIQNGEILDVNITKVGDGYVWIYEVNDWYDAIDDSNPGRLEDMETDGEEQSFQWPYAFNDGNIQNITFVVPISESTNGIVETARVNVNGADITPYHSQESGNHDGEMWYYYKVPINGNLDIQLIHETNGRHLSVKNGDGSGSIEIYNLEGEEMLSVSTNQASSGEYLVRQSGYYAIIQPRTGKEVSAIFTTGMQQLLPPANYLLDDGTYFVPLAGFETNTTNEYQLSVLYADGAVEPWISYHHEGLIGSLGGLIDALPESQKNAIEQLSVSMNMRAKDLAAIRYLGGKPNYYTKPDTQGSLTSLDLTDAVFYESDEVFYTDESGEYKINTRNVMPYGFLAGMHLETLYLPKTLQGFEEGALMNVNNHLVVYAPWKTPLDLSTSSGFGDEVAQMDLYVPAGSFDAYAADAEWGKFGFIWEYGTIEPEIIQFADANVKAICVANWDNDHDGELSKDEAANVTTLKVGENSVFRDNATITSFDELQYFTGLTSVEDHAFSSCTNLTSVVVPKDVTTIENAAFSGCSNLSIVLPEGLTSIGNDGFRNCVYMKEISLPESLTKIGSSALAGCITLKTLYIPKNLTSIGYQALANLKGLLSIAVDPANPQYDSRNGCNAVITTASNAMVTGCQNTNLPEGVKVISGMFNQNHLQSFVIPSSATSVAAVAFYNCSQLKTVVAKGVTPPTLGNDAFKGIHADCVLWVPYGKTQAYRVAGWGDGQDGSASVFKEIKELPSKYDVNEDGTVSISDVTKLVNVILGKEN